MIELLKLILVNLFVMIFSRLIILKLVKLYIMNNFRYIYFYYLIMLDLF